MGQATETIMGREKKTTAYSTENTRGPKCVRRVWCLVVPAKTVNEGFTALLTWINQQAATRKLHGRLPAEIRMPHDEQTSFHT